MSDLSYDQEQARSLKARHSSEEGTQTKQAHPSVGMLLHMQRTAGNAAVNALLSSRSASVQRAVATEEGEQDTKIGERIRAASGGGSAIGGEVQRTLESGLGASMSNVRVHNDSESDHLARSVDSVAFTTGSDIFFRSGAYSPETPQGMHLLAHEATHTVQQSQGPVSGTPAPGGVSISDPGDSFERAAEANASRVMSGVAAQRMSASPAGPAGTAVQRAAPEEEEPLQAMRSAQYATVQREAEGAEEEEEQVQAMRSAQYATVQREAEGGEEEEEQMQAMRSAQYATVQREAEGAEGEEEELQAMRSAQFASVQREAEGAEDEEEQVQAMRSAQYATVQRHTADEEA